MIIDAHQHFWNLDRVAYPWLTPDQGPIHRTFEEGDLRPHLDACGVDGTVLVQSADSYADTDFMLEVADRWPRVRAVVGWVPLTRPDEAAEALDRYRRDPRYAGVRHLIHEEPDPDWLLQPVLRDGLDALAERGLTFDVVAVLPRHLEHVPMLAERHPGLRLVIDHLAKPPIAERGWRPWADLLARAAAFPNVHAKVSGLNTAADHGTWTAADLRPYVEHALELFGAERLMFGGDWPISVLAGGYRKVWNETAKVLDDLALTPGDRARVLGGTAADVYRIPGPARPGAVPTPA
ncbi:amidohydrolase family protein [Actinomadura sp. LD22]|uniref:Amidohydrolase family protein n=1 Tax=Actinomadura physcomitrii TaxID=2650748 RepID=A0A6I4MHE6_9ACTN|nr:amidohydrolase family protein [Actinomadura physcomitrii]MWA03574.1 amidohydrolase family protein [Actinomadura physcomitrii]